MPSHRPTVFHGSEWFGPLVRYRIGFHSGLAPDDIQDFIRRIRVEAGGRATVDIETIAPLAIVGMMPKALLERYIRMHADKAFHNQRVSVVESGRDGVGHGLLSVRGRLAWHDLARAVVKLANEYVVNIRRLKNSSMPRVPFVSAEIVFRAEPVQMARLADALRRDRFWRQFDPALFLSATPFDVEDAGGSMLVEIVGKESNVGMIASMWERLLPFLGPDGYIDLDAQEVWPMPTEEGQPWRALARIAVTGERQNSDVWSAIKITIDEWAEEMGLRAVLRDGLHVVFEFPTN